MAKPPFISRWERGYFFGAAVIRGYVNGERVTALVRYWSHGRFGVSWGSAGAEMVWREGTPAPTAWEHLLP